MKKIWYTYKGTVLKRCCDAEIKEYRVECGTVEIKARAFMGCESLETVYIPDSVESIGADTFYGCKNLRCVIIEECPEESDGYGLYEIKDGAFAECPNLCSIELPDSLSELGSLVFANCTSLREVTLPESLDMMGANPFVGCNINVKSKSNKFKVFKNMLIGKDTLIGFLKDTEIVKIPDEITKIGNSAFKTRKELKMVIFPKYISSVGEYAFYGCSSLIYVDMRNSRVSKIGNWAFCESGIASFTFPDGLEEIGDYAFSNCKRLTSVYKSGKKCEIVSSDNEETADGEEEKAAVGENSTADGGNNNRSELIPSGYSSKAAYFGYSNEYYEGTLEYFGYDRSMLSLPWDKEQEEKQERKRKRKNVCEISATAFEGSERCSYRRKLRIKN